ncbi:ribonuclease H-like domain-containing protein [Tanacetum coccineum]
MSGSQDEIPPPPPPPSSQTPIQQTPYTVSTIKLHILKKGEYDIWAMKMEHYLAHTDYLIWEVIQNGNGPVSITTDTQGQIKVLPPRTAKEILARERDRKARTTLLMALPEDHLAKFHKITDAKEMWDAIKSRFGGNDESKKMQKYILKQQFEGVSTEDANQKFLRSLPSALSQVSLITRTKLGVDSLSFDDLYNNLRVFENDVKGSTASSSSTQNVAFVSENTISTNDVSTAYGVSNPSGHNSQYEQTSSYSLLANQSSCPQLDHEDLEQLDEFDLEEMDLKWQVAMISMRMKKFYKKTGRKLQFDAKEPVGFDKTKVECYNCHKTGHFARECRTKGNQDNRRRDAWNSGNKDGRRSGKQEDSKALVTIDGEGVDWTSHSEEEEDYALMACNSSGSDTELVAHQQGQLWYEQKIKFMKIDLDDKTDVLTYHKKLLAEAQKEKEDLKAKVEKWHNSSKNLSKLLNTQMSANDKFGLGYGDHRYDGILSYENEVLQSVFMNKESELEKQPLYDSESESQSSEFDTRESNISIEPSELVSEPVVNESNVECQPKVWSDAPIIEEYESDSEDEYVSIATKEQETPSFANQQVKTPRETVKNQFTHSQKPKVDKKELGYGFTIRACFVCGSLNHLIRDCDFHKKRMARKAVLNNGWNRKSSEREIRASGTKNVSTARQSFNRQAVLTSTSMKVNTGLSTIGALKNKGIIDSGCSRHMTGNKGLPSDFKDINGGPIAFGCSKRLHHYKGEGQERRNSLLDGTANDLRGKDGCYKELNALRKDTVSTPAKASSTNLVNTVSTPVSTASPHDGLSLFDPTNPEQDDSEIPPLEDIYQNSIDALILGDPTSAVQTRSKVNKSSGAHAFVSYVQTQRRNNHKDFQHCLFACFLSQNKPKKISEALEDKSWVDAMQEELLQFKIQKVWIHVDLPFGKKAIGTKWVYRNKKDERGVVVRNKARLVAQGHRQEEGIDYDEVFAPVARIEAIRIFLAFASYMGFIVYQMDVKSASLFGKIDEEVYVSQPPGFLDPKYPQKNGYRRGTIDKTLFIKKDKHDIILVQVYVDDIIFGSTKKSWCDEFEALMKKILKKFDFANVKTTSTPIETQKPLVKDEEANDVDVHLYRSMISSLMYLTASRPDIMFTVCACSRFQVTPKSSHLSVVKRIFRYLKGKPKLGLWYPRVSSFDLESYSDSDYAGANLDRKSTTGGCQFLGRRLISWQCKKQTIVATSTTEAEYVAAANLWASFVDSKSNVRLWVQFYEHKDLH